MLLDSSGPSVHRLPCHVPWLLCLSVLFVLLVPLAWAMQLRSLCVALCAVRACCGSVSSLANCLQASAPSTLLGSLTSSGLGVSEQVLKSALHKAAAEEVASGAVLV